jgi:hypothetical protein
MNKLPIALLVSAMTMSVGVLAADQVKPDSKPIPGDCSKLSGKEKDKCTQATPAGPVEMQTGAQKKGKSEIAKDRDRAKEDSKAGTETPAQSGDSVGQPAKRSSTGEAQTGAGNSSAGNAVPAQSKDTVGKPKQRTTTGEAQTGQDSGTGSATKTQ